MRRAVQYLVIALVAFVATAGATVSPRELSAGVCCKAVP